MKHQALILAILAGLALALLAALHLLAPADASRMSADNPAPPATPVKLIFIHHSTGGHWLADPNADQPYGGLGRALMNNNYYVSATNYGWGPDGIGDRTDIPNWPEWFTGPNSAAILTALYSETGQNFGEFGAWPRLATAPAGENQIVMFKSCFPNSDLYGAPNDPPLSEPNDELTVANAKAVYNKILPYFNRWREGGASTPTATSAPTRTRTPTSTATVPPPLGTPSPTPTRTTTATSQWPLYLPLILRPWPPSAAATPTATATNTPILNTPTPTPTGTRTATPTGTATQAVARLIQPADLVYRGAFRLPEGAERPRTFEYGGNAMTFRPAGDPAGPADGFPGSLFITGHDRLPYGELPNGSQVAEVNIPAPVVSRNLADLPVVAFLQGFHDVTSGHFTQMEEIVRIGMAYLDHPATGPKIHLAWGQHIEPDPPAATHAWFSPNLLSPDFRGDWFIGNQSFYAVNDYLFEIPAVWADIHAQGRYLATGRFKDGGWSGMGPALFAYRPWQSNGSPPPSGTRLAETVLLRYESSLNTENIERCLAGYQHPDEWAGGAWITTGTGKTAVLFAGAKSNGAKYWYGYANPAGPDYPCVDGDVVGEFTTCRLANGAPCPPEDLIECAGHNDYRGWWTTRWDAQFIFYDPADLARVAAGQADPWTPQPYAVMDIDEHLYLNPASVETDMLGAGVQRRYRIGDVAYDRANGLLYVLELFADQARPVVHVWEIR